MLLITGHVICITILDTLITVYSIALSQQYLITLGVIITQSEYSVVAILIRSPGIVTDDPVVPGSVHLVMF